MRAEGVPSVVRLLDIIDFFADLREPATLSAIATTLSLPRSSCLAILETLVARGYLYEVAPRKGYYPTRQWLEKFNAIGEADPLRERVRVQMERLEAATGETIVFARRAEINVVYLDVIEARESLRYVAKIGELRPLHATASGKAILSVYPEAERRRLLRGCNYAAMTARTITTIDELMRDVERGAQRGYHLSDGETEENLMGVAACTILGGEPYALVVGGPIPRVAPRREEFAGYLKDACEKLTKK